VNLTAIAVRIAAVQALTGATFAAGRVFDSSFDQIDTLALNTKMPVITVLTDDDKLTIAGRDVLAADRDLQIVIEIAVATRLVVAQGGEDIEAIEVPPTDANLEATVNIMGRQALRALFAADGFWADLFRSFVTSVKTIESVRGAEVKNGIRYAARALVITVDTIADPPFGQPPEEGTPWAVIIASMKADARLAKLGALLEAEASGAAADWKVAKAALGLTADEALAMGIVPLVEDDGQAEPATQFIVEQDGFADFIVDASNADQAGPA
jgi:hypothetical protein